MSRAYDVLAPYYDLIRPLRRGEIEYWVSCARRYGGRVLEMGCGTGRVLEAMATVCRPGCAWGLDTSPVMLGYARRRLSAGRVRAHLRRADMRAFRLPGRFSFIAIPYRTFQHLLTHDDQTACLECVREHLDPGGTLVLDVGGASPTGAADGVCLSRSQVFESGPDGPLWSTLTVVVDVETGLARQTRTLSREGRMLARAQMVVRYLRDGEMPQVLGRSGFRVVENWGGFLGETPAPGGDQVWVARAP